MSGGDERETQSCISQGVFAKVGGFSEQFSEQFSPNEMN
jgi:hypothetical protein